MIIVSASFLPSFKICRCRRQRMKPKSGEKFLNVLSWIILPFQGKLSSSIYFAVRFKGEKFFPTTLHRKQFIFTLRGILKRVLMNFALRLGLRLEFHEENFSFIVFFYWSVVLPFCSYSFKFIFHLILRTICSFDGVWKKMPSSVPKKFVLQRKEITKNIRFSISLQQLRTKVISRIKFYEQNVFCERKLVFKMKLSFSSPFMKVHLLKILLGGF